MIALAIVLTTLKIGNEECWHISYEKNQNIKMVSLEPNLGGLTPECKFITPPSYMSIIPLQNFWLHITVRCLCGCFPSHLACASYLPPHALITLVWLASTASRLFHKNTKC